MTRPRAFHPTEVAEVKGADDRPALGKTIAAMRDTLGPGVQVVTPPHPFPTPADPAARMIELADIQPIQPGQTILEPSAGTGVLCKAITTAEPTASVFAVELNHRLSDLLSNTITPPRTEPKASAETYWRATFWSASPWEVPRIVMNPPFQNGDDIKHLTHALCGLALGGRLVALCADGPRQNAQFRPLVEELGGTWEELPADTFHAAGTSARTVLLTVPN